MAGLRIAFVDNSVMDSVANKLKAYIEGVLPADLVSRLFIASAHRGNTNVDYHEDTGSNGAIDIDGSDTDMRDAAEYLIRDADLLLELIHTTPFNTDNGFYVKNGQVISTYGAQTDAQHLNHIHLASSESMSDQLIARHPVSTAPEHTDTQTNIPSDPNAVLFGYDGSDFTHVRNFNGLSFVTHKITEAVDPGEIYVHQQFGLVMADAANQGVPFLGAYVVPRTGGYSPDEEADVAIAELNRQAPWLLAHPGFFWQVDLEHWGYDNTAPEEGVALANALTKKTGKRAVIYAPQWAYGNTVPLGYPLWSSSYTESGPARNYRDMYVGSGGQGWQPYSGQVPVIWQYASDALFDDGNPGDANAFRGNLADFRRVILGQVPGSGSAEDNDMRLEEIIVLRNMANNWDPNRAEFKAGGAGAADLAAWDVLTGGDPNKRINGVKQELDEIRDTLKAIKTHLNIP